MRIHLGCLTLVFGLWVGTPSPALAQDVDPAFRADIVKMMEVTGTSKIGRQMATMISQQMLQMTKAQHPEVPAHGFEVVRRWRRRSSRTPSKARTACSREWSPSMQVLDSRGRARADRV